MKFYNLSPQEAYEKAKQIGTRTLELEKIIFQTPKWTYLYIRDVVGCRLPEAEPIIAQSSIHAYYYAFEMGIRFTEGEPAIAQNAYYAYQYARDVIKGHWEEAESVICLYPDFSLNYSFEVLKERFYEGEEAISQSGFSNKYTELWFDEPVVTKNQVDDFVWRRSGAKGYYAPERLFKERIAVLDFLV